MIAMIGAVTAGCGVPSEVQKSSPELHSKQTNQTNTPPSSDITKQDTKDTTLSTRKYTDYKGHSVIIPVVPQRIIYHGETYGDLLALGVKAVGGGNVFVTHPIYKERGIEIQDIGLPINPEKTMALKPDLIIFANADENEYKKISQIAPTVTFNSFAPLAERIQTLGKILDKKKEAKKWLDSYDTKATSMWQHLRSKITPGETASVFLYEHGKHLYVMGTAGLSSALYHPLGFQPVPNYKKSYIQIQVLLKSRRKTCHNMLVIGFSCFYPLIWSLSKQPIH
ncbi:ABC transporter substrate-binding protein [Brevibacillus laterosporus]|nr:ABC transporter substrate-binding protein [Brevibacillus laterosporus]